jgi:hypothetical protein
MLPAIFTSMTAAAAVTRSSVESLAEARINQLQSRMVGHGGQMNAATASSHFTDVVLLHRVTRNVRNPGA